MAAGNIDGLAPAGFFALRSPLLPFDELSAWSAGLGAPAAASNGGDAKRLAAALDEDRALLTDRLLEFARRPEVREAIFLASPELDAALGRSAPGESRVKALRSLVAYFARMAGRSTPFALFAGCSVGSVEPRTHLELGPRSSYGRHTRLDMEYLSVLVSALERDPVVRPTLRYQPNSSLYHAGARLHYAEARIDASGRSYHLVALDVTPELAATLERAAVGASVDELAAGLVDAEISFTEAREFVEELIASQVLMSNLGPPVTGDEPVHALIARLESHDATRGVAASLDHVRDGLERIDTSGVGGSTPERYAELRASLDALPARAEPARLFQTDMLKPADGLSLGRAVSDELMHGVAMLQRLADGRDVRDALRDFAERFEARYEGAEVPLVEALDEELGIGFGTREPSGEPLLHGLDQPARSSEPTAWSTQDDVKLRLLADALQHGEQASSSRRRTWTRSRRRCRHRCRIRWRCSPDSPPPPPRQWIAVIFASCFKARAVLRARGYWDASATPIPNSTARSRSTFASRRRTGPKQSLPRSSTCLKDGSGTSSADRCCASTRSRF